MRGEAFVEQMIGGRKQPPRDKEDKR